MYESISDILCLITSSKTCNILLFEFELMSLVNKILKIYFYTGTD